MNLGRVIADAAQRWPNATAIRAPDGRMTYGELATAADRGANALLGLGVEKGDRVGILLEKSGRAIAAMQAALRVGAAYVPLDVLAPPARNLGILRDGGIEVVFSARDFGAELGAPAGMVRWVSADGGLDGVDLRDVGDGEVPEVSVSADDLAYILYTSGSTGVPKGVSISHRNALAFISWAQHELQLAPSDRLANHAPFTFDLSVFDLYATFLGGASVSIVPERAAYHPRRLVELIERDEISVWYSVPSALILMMEHGGLLERAPASLRAIIFAGEPFPVKQLRRLREHFPAARLLNFYGPTETNVCTSYEVGSIEPDRVEPVPIGAPACGDRAWLRPVDGHESAQDEADSAVGELIVEGPTVMLGYWGHAPHRGPYATGDICRRLPDGNYAYIGRLDNMVKVRGHRVELGEIESALVAHPSIEHAAVIVSGSGMDAKLVAFVVAREEVSLVGLKLHCAARLPQYMIINEVRCVGELPRTRNGKVDRSALSHRIAEWSAHHGNYSK